jgi:hypothetical protein
MFAAAKRFSDLLVSHALGEKAYVRKHKTGTLPVGQASSLG